LTLAGAAAFTGFLEAEAALAGFAVDFTTLFFGAGFEMFFFAAMAH
jgi:hypothetical protein